MTRCHSALVGTVAHAHRHADIVLHKITHHLADRSKPLKQIEHQADRSLRLLVGIKDDLTTRPPPMPPAPLYRRQGATLQRRRAQRGNQKDGRGSARPQLSLPARRSWHCHPQHHGDGAEPRRRLRALPEAHSSPGSCFPVARCAGKVIASSQAADLQISESDQRLLSRDRGNFGLGRRCLNRLVDRCITVLRFVDPCRDRPHPHCRCRIRPQ